MVKSVKSSSQPVEIEIVLVRSGVLQALALASDSGLALESWQTRGDLVIPVQISALSRELIFYKSRLDGLVRSVEIIGRTWSQGARKG